MSTRSERISHAFAARGSHDPRIKYGVPGIPKEDSGQQTLYDYSYTYDAVGNRTKKRDEVAQSDTNYTYNNMNQMTAAGNITYTYDDAGNMLTKVVNQQTTTYTWDFRNKMLKVDFPSGDDPVMRYEGDGLRVYKKMGATVTRYLYGQAEFAVRPPNSDGILFGVQPLLFETDGQGSKTGEYRRSSGGELISMKRGGTMSYYHFDHLGSTRALTNASETVTDTYKYDAWGEGTASSGSTANPFKFVGALGYYTDPDVGLLLLQGRWYSREAGRFVSVDPLHVGANLYLYAMASPLGHLDPTGLQGRTPLQCCLDDCDASMAGCAALCLVVFGSLVAACVVSCAIVCIITPPLCGGCMYVCYQLAVQALGRCLAACSVAWAACYGVCWLEYGA